MSVITFFEDKSLVKAVAFTVLNVAILIGVFRLSQLFGLQGMAVGVFMLCFKFVAALVFLYMLYKAHVFSILNNWAFGVHQYAVVAIWAVFLVPAIFIDGFSVSEGSSAWFVLLSHQSTGFYEEFQFRAVLVLGLLFAYVKSDAPSPVIRAIIVSSVCFGGVHLINVLMGNGLVPTLLQVVSATFAGIAFGLLVVITRNIWLASVIHGIFNSLDLGDVYTFIPGDFVILVVAILITAISLVWYKPAYANALVADFRTKLAI